MIETEKHKSVMKEQFDFNKVGKRMPYEVPQDFFPQLEERVLHEVQASTPAQPRAKVLHSTWFKRLVPLSAVAAAAIVALLLVPRLTGRQATPPAGSYAQVEQAFDNLDAADQQFLVDAYQDDPFLNQ